FTPRAQDTRSSGCEDPGERLTHRWCAGCELMLIAVTRRHRALLGRPRIGDTARMTDATQVVYQGEPGAFPEEAVLGLFGEATARAAVPTWRAVFEAVADGSAAAGVIAIERSLAGTIRETYDLLAEV